MPTVLTETEESLLPYMTNDLYSKNFSVIARHFPILSLVGQRLVDNGLLTSSEYVDISSLSKNVAGNHLICHLEKKGDDSMGIFYKVLLGAREERDVAVILQHLEEEAQRRRDCREMDVHEGPVLPPLEEAPSHNQMRKKSSTESVASSGFNSSVSTSSIPGQQLQLSAINKHLTNLQSDVKQMRSELRGEMTQLRKDMSQFATELRGQMSQTPAEQKEVMSQLVADLRGLSQLAADLRGLSQLAEQKEVILQLAADMQRVLGNISRIPQLYAEGSSSGKLSTASTASFTTCSSEPFDSPRAKRTSAQTTCSSRSERAQSEPDVGKHLLPRQYPDITDQQTNTTLSAVPEVTEHHQTSTALHTPSEAMERQMDTGTSLCTVPGEIAPTTSDIPPPHSLNVEGDTNEKEGIGHLGGGTDVTTSTSHSEDSHPSPEHIKARRKSFSLKSFLRRKPDGP